MKKLDVSSVSNSNGIPVKGGTLQFLQDSYQEALNAIASNLLGKSVDSTKMYRLFGVNNSGTGQNFVISAGALYYNGEVFLVDATTFTADAGRTAVAEIVTTQFTAQADPVLFTDGIERNVHNIRKIRIVSGLSGAGIGDFSTILESGYITKSETVADLGTAYTLKFDQERAVYFQAATGNATISFDLTNAIEGAVARLKFTLPAGNTLTIASQAGITVVLEGLALTAAPNKTNVMYCCYLGKNAAGAHEIAVNLKNI